MGEASSEKKLMKSLTLRLPFFRSMNSFLSLSTPFFIFRENETAAIKTEKFAFPS